MPRQARLFGVAARAEVTPRESATRLSALLQSLQALLVPSAALLLDRRSVIPGRHDVSGTSSEVPLDANSSCLAVPGIDCYAVPSEFELPDLLRRSPRQLRNDAYVTRQHEMGHAGTEEVK